MSCGFLLGGSERENNDCSSSSVSLAGLLALAPAQAKHHRHYRKRGAGMTAETGREWAVGAKAGRGGTDKTRPGGPRS